MSETTIFDRILAGEIPCHKVYEDDLVLAFLDIFPLSPGHTLVIPKERAAYLHDLSQASAAAIGRCLPAIAAAACEAAGAEAYNVLQNNGAAAHQAVFHVHFHVIPRVGKRGLGVGWEPGELDDEEASRLLSAMHRSLERS